MYLFTPRWLTYGTSVGAGRPAALDALLILVRSLSNRGHVHGHPCGEGAGLLGPRWGRTRDSTLIRKLFTEAFTGTHS